jgi:hypothetical protein
MPNLEEIINEIRITLAEIKTELKYFREQNHEERIREIEDWKNRSKGYIAGIAAIVSFVITLAGIFVMFLTK